MSVTETLDKIIGSYGYDYMGNVDSRRYLT